jgi:hypothetical protein
LGKRPLGRQRRGREDNFKLDFREKVVRDYGGRNWFRIVPIGRLCHQRFTAEFY